MVYGGSKDKTLKLGIIIQWERYTFKKLILTL